MISSNIWLDCMSNTQRAILIFSTAFKSFISFILTIRCYLRSYKEPKYTKKEDEGAAAETKSESEAGNSSNRESLPQ